ncbi:MAG: carbohydrate kinase [Actinomycetia bacterium]|nr:carbohydrate kinase [Actinomycetes bacterium]
MRILAIDQGTSGTKAIVVEDGSVVSLAEVAVHPSYPEPGAVEQDPHELLDSVLSAGRQALAAAGGIADAVALANQGETVLAWDPNSGRPLSPAIVWQDSRAQSICDELSDHADFVSARTGLVLDPYFSAPKAAWLRRHHTTEGVVTTSDSWLVHQLTGEFVTDVATASRSLLLDLDAVAWDPELLNLFGLAAEQLPTLVSNDEVVGATSAFGAEAPLAGLVVDQQAALLAEACLQPGNTKCTYGTGAFLLSNTGQIATRSQHGLTSSVAWRTRYGTQYCLDGQVFTAASAVQWMVEIGLLDDVRALDSAAAPESGDVRFVPALAGLAAPWWRSGARGTFVGLSLATTRGQLVRAVIEGLAATIAALVAVVADDTGTRPTTLRVDGGLTHSRVLMQAQADILQVPIEVYPSAHATALGAAALATVAVAPKATLAEALSPWSPVTVYEPRWSTDRAVDFMAKWRTVADRVAEDHA